MAVPASGYVRLYYNGTSTDYRIIDLKGLPTAEYYDLYPAEAALVEGLSGRKRTKYTGYRRRALLDLGVVKEFADRVALVLWMNDNARKLSYNYLGHTGDLLELVPREGFVLESEWVNGQSIGRRYVLPLDEADIRLTAAGFPA